MSPIQKTICQPIIYYTDTFADGCVDLRGIELLRWQSHVVVDFIPHFPYRDQYIHVYCPCGLEIRDISIERSKWTWSTPIVFEYPLVIFPELNGGVVQKITAFYGIFQHAMFDYRRGYCIVCLSLCYDSRFVLGYTWERISQVPPMVCEYMSVA